MAPVIWGLDLKEITWAKFGNKNMWSNHYHLRRTKFIVYQLAMIFCVVSESLGTAAMSDYLDQKEVIEPLTNYTVEENVRDYVGIASYNIFAGVYVAFIFGGAFFFDLIWPERYESPMVRTAWRVCSVLAIVFHGAAAFALTIITARNSATVTGISEDRVPELLTHAKFSPLRYNANGRAIAACVFIWPGWLCVIASTIIMYSSMGNQDRFGTTVAAHDRTGNEKMELENGSNGSAVAATAKPQITTHPSGHTQGSSEQPLVDRAGPDFENDTTAAIDGVRRSPETSHLASNVPNSSQTTTSPPVTVTGPHLG